MIMAVGSGKVPDQVVASALSVEVGAGIATSETAVPDVPGLVVLDAAIVILSV